MAEVLSQSQIDALMKKMQSGGDESVEKEEKKEEKSYRKYDFSSPKKITKYKIRLLRGVYDNFCRIASSRLNGLLRIACEMEVLSVEEQRYYEFNNALGENDIMTTQTLNLPSHVKTAPVLMHMNQMPVVTMIDCMLGGDGSYLEHVDNNYVYTEIELSLYRKIMNYLLDFSVEAWSNYIGLSGGTIYVEENPSLFQKISLDETVVIIILKIKVGDAEGLITVCIPRTLMNEIFAVIDSKKSATDDESVQQTDSKDIIFSKIRRSTLTVSASMGSMLMPMGDIHNLKVGDVIDLQKSVDSDVYLNVKGIPWLKGKLGTYKKNVAVLVDTRLEEDEKELIAGKMSEIE